MDFSDAFSRFSYCTERVAVIGKFGWRSLRFFFFARDVVELFRFFTGISKENEREGDAFAVYLALSIMRSKAFKRRRICVQAKGHSVLVVWGS